MLQRLPRRAKSLHKGISANFTTGDNGCEKGGGLPKVIVQVGATAEAAVAADAALGVEGSAAADVARGPMQGRASKKFFGHQLNQLHSRHGPTQWHPSTLQAAGGAAAGEAATAAEAAATAEAVVAADAVVAAEGAWRARMWLIYWVVTCASFLRLNLLKKSCIAVSL